MIERALSLLSRLALLLAPLGRQQDFIAIPVRRDERRVRHHR